MLQRQIIFKQLQEMQQQQQLQQLGDVRQQNYVNQLSLLNKQSSGGFHPPPVNGMPIHDASQKFIVGNMHMAQHVVSPAMQQGFPNGLVFPQSQNQAMAIGMLPQQHDVSSLYGTPITSSGSTMSQYSHFQTVSYDPANMLAQENNNQTETSIMQLSTASNSFLIEQFNTSADKFSISDGTFAPQSSFHGKNLFAQVSEPTSNAGVLPLNFQRVNIFQRNASIRESGMRQDQTCWPDISQEKTPKLGSSQGTASLDPLEEKILFSSDDSIWESALGRHGNIAASGVEGNRDYGGFMGTSTQSGRWSALMQSAVAEASSSDTGQQEEWSGLTFQNPVLSSDNQPTNYIGNGKQQDSWLDNNLWSGSSPTSEPDIICQNSDTNYNFPGFQPSTCKQREGMHSDSSHESIYQSSNNAAKWFGCNSQQKQPIKGCELGQTVSPVHGVLHDQQFQFLQNDECPSSMSPCRDGSQPHPSEAGSELEENIWKNQSRTQLLVGGGQNPCQATHNSGYPGQLNSTGNASNIGMDFGNRSLSGLKEITPGKNVDSAAALFGNPADYCRQNISAHTSSENMLDLFNTDTYLKHSSGVQLGSRDSASISQVSGTETSGGLRLGSSPQQMPKSYPSLNCATSVNSGTQCSTFTSSPWYIGNHLQNQHMYVAPVASQSAPNALHGFTGRFQSGSVTPQHSCNFLQTGHHSQDYSTLDTKQTKLLSQMSVVARPHGSSMGQQALRSEMAEVSLNSLPSPDSTNNNVEMGIGTLYEQEKPNSAGQTTQGSDCKDRQALTSLDQLSQQEFVTKKHLSEINTYGIGSPLNIIPHLELDIAQERENIANNISERNLETFGHSLRPSHGQHQASSLPNQVGYLKILDAGGGNRAAVKFTKVDSGLVFQYLNANARQQILCANDFGVRNAVSKLNSFSSGENKPLSCSSNVSGNQPDKGSDEAFVQNRGIVMFGPTDSHTKPQPFSNMEMSPSWYKNFAISKNGQLLPVHDIMGVKDHGGQLPIGKSSENFQMISSIVQVNNSNARQQSSLLPTSATNKETEQDFAVFQPKKRKLAAFDLLPWNEEVAQSSLQLQKICRVAESEWASASNRLIEQEEKKSDINENLLPISRAKRRLVLTTQLMQQILQPAPAVLLSEDTLSSSEGILYYMCRLTLGDSCSLISGFSMPLVSNMSSTEQEHSYRIADQDLLRSVDNFADRAKMLQSDFLRLDKAGSITDLRFELQELEKYSMVNGFAKFHIREGVVSVETSSNSGAPPSVRKALAKRYIVAHPMPKMVPDVTNCISL